MRAAINKIIEAYAKRVGFNYYTGIIPKELAGTGKQPFILWVAPDAVHENNRGGRYRYNSTIYVVSEATKDDEQTTRLDELQSICAGLHREFRDPRYIEENGGNVYAESIATIRPKYGFDNSGAIAVEMSITIYYDNGCD